MLSHSSYGRKIALGLRVSRSTVGGVLLYGVFWVRSECLGRSVGLGVRALGVGAEVEALHEALELLLRVRLGGQVGRVVLAVDLVAHELVFIDAADIQISDSQQEATVTYTQGGVPKVGGGGGLLPGGPGRPGRRI